MSNTFDYLVVGGGSGGAVVAGRLSEDAATGVCMLEAGGDGDDAAIRIPSARWACCRPGSTTGPSRPCRSPA